MKQLTQYILRHLSVRLGLLIVAVTTAVFALLFNFVLPRCKNYIQRAAIERATRLLDNTALRIDGIMEETELVTNFMATTTPRHLHPDSLLAYTHRTVRENSFLTGFGISMEPYYFPDKGRYYSAYSLRDRSSATDSITTVREGPFEYFDAVWYKTPRTLGTACWVDAYDDYNEGTLSSPDVVCSYCCPMRDAEGRFIGSITASLTLKWLSESVTRLKPYPNSAAIMVDRQGAYLVHPDTAKLFRETIFSDPDPQAISQIRAMGRSMLSGHSGMTETIVDGRPAFIFYRPVQRTGWSIAIVCPASDIFVRYNQLLTIVWIVIGVSLLALMAFCLVAVRHAMLPLRQLDQQARRIAEGHFDEPLPQSRRRDSIGRLTNSFILMQQSLATMVTDLRQVNEQLEQHNDELSQAYRIQLDTNRRREQFIHDMYHEIRTPLNIISGFAQVLSSSQHALQPDEVADITSRMQQSAGDISRLAHQLEQA